MTGVSMTVDAVDHARPGTLSRWVLAFTQFLLILDTAVLNVAAPVIATDLDMGLAGRTWILNAYTVTFGGLLLLAGWLADVIGRGRALRAGLLTLAAAAAFGAFSTSGALVIASRALQGVGAALAAAAAMSLVLGSFSGPDRQRMLGMFAAMAGLGGAFGTVLGGVLTDWISWRSAFWLNVVGGLLLVTVTRGQAIFHDAGRRRPFNAVGALAMTCSLAAAIYGLTDLASVGLGPSALTALGVAAVGLVVFLLSEKRSRTPLLPAALWRSPGLVRALLLAGAGQWVLVPSLFVISVYLQEVLDQAPSRAGLGLLPMSILICLFAPRVPGMVGRFGLRLVMASSFGVVAAAMAWLCLLRIDSSYLGAVLGPTLLVAIGLPAVAITTNIAAAQAAPPEEPGLTSGLLTTSQQFGATIGLAAWLIIAVVASNGSPEGTARGYVAAFGAGAVMAVIAALAALRTRRA